MPVWHVHDGRPSQRALSARQGNAADGSRVTNQQTNERRHIYGQRRFIVGPTDEEQESEKTHARSTWGTFPSKRQHYKAMSQWTHGVCDSTDNCLYLTRHGFSGEWHLAFMKFLSIHSWFQDQSTRTVSTLLTGVYLCACSEK